MSDRIIIDGIFRLAEREAFLPESATLSIDLWHWYMFSITVLLLIWLLVLWSFYGSSPVIKEWQILFLYEPLTTADNHLSVELAIANVLQDFYRRRAFSKYPFANKLREKNAF